MSEFDACKKCGFRDASEDDYPVLFEDRNGDFWCFDHEPVGNFVWGVARKYPTHIETTEDLAEIIEEAIWEWRAGEVIEKPEGVK